MKIVEGIDELARKIKEGEIDAEDLAKAGVDAVYDGMKRGGVTTTSWVNLMEYIAPNGGAELRRLCGDDEVFNKSKWGMASLAYIAGNSTCTSDTNTTGGTRRAMSLEMVKNLDAEGVDLVNFEDPGTESAFNASHNASQKKRNA